MAAAVAAGTKVQQPPIQTNSPEESQGFRAWVVKIHNENSTRFFGDCVEITNETGAIATVLKVIALSPLTFILFPIWDTGAWLINKIFSCGSSCEAKNSDTTNKVKGLSPVEQKAAQQAAEKLSEERRQRARAIVQGLRPEVPGAKKPEGHGAKPPVGGAENVARGRFVAPQVEKTDEEVLTAALKVPANRAAILAVFGNHGISALPALAGNNHVARQRVVTDAMKTLVAGDAAVPHFTAAIQPVLGFPPSLDQVKGVLNLIAQSSITLDLLV